MKNKIEEIAKSRKPRKFVPPTLNYQLGTYVGEFILSNILPTLETDMIKTNRVIEVDEDDKQKLVILENLYEDTREHHYDGGSSELFRDIVKFRYELLHKYLPKKLECVVPAVYPTNIVEFKQAIVDTLWGSDLCSYKCTVPDDIELLDTYNGSWSTIINLTLSEYK